MSVRKAVRANTLNNRTGVVYLVGAGPGDAGLLTLRALERIRAADVLVYDRLVSAEVLDLVPTGVSRVYVGKAPGCHHATQSDINDMLIRLAASGHSVVRLKGGDPFVFGRGAEEALALVRARIPFEVVPGVTAATACAAYAGIPLTHRGVARGVQFVSGHCREDIPLDIDWSTVADEGVTVAIYMGLANVSELRAGLLSVGRSSGTPVALIERGCTAHQRVIRTSLDALTEDVRRLDVRAPCLIVVGEVVRLSTTLGWFEDAQALDKGALGSGHDIAAIPSTI